VALTPEQRAQLEELRELSAEIELLRERHRNLPRPAAKWVIFEEIRVRKHERRVRVGALAREGLSPSMIAPAADLTPEAVSVLGRSG
jgi:hypothetical protein